MSEEGILYQGVENKLEVTDLENESMQSVQFNQQTEGSVNLLAVRNNLLAMATSTNLLKLFTIQKGVVKPLVTRKFEKEGNLLGEIKSLEINADASHVAMLCDKSPLPSIKIPDTHFYIYDVAMDRFVDKDAGFNRIPIDLYWDEEEVKMLAVETEYVQDISKELDDSDIEADVSRNMNTPALMGHHHSAAHANLADDPLHHMGSRS